MEACVERGRKDDNPMEKSDQAGDNASGAKVETAALAHQQHLAVKGGAVGAFFCFPTK